MAKCVFWQIFLVKYSPAGIEINAPAMTTERIWGISLNPVTKAAIMATPIITVAAIEYIIENSGQFITVFLIGCVGILYLYTNSLQRVSVYMRPVQYLFMLTE